MPLTNDGKKILKKMIKTYRSSEKGKQVFYASINAGKAGSKKWHKKTETRRRKHSRPLLAGRA